MGIRRVPLHAVPVSRRGSPSRQVAGQQAIDMSGGLGSDTARTFRCAGLSPPRGVSVCNGRGRRGGGRSRPLLQRLLSLYCVSDILTRALRRPCHTLRASRILSRREGSALSYPWQAPFVPESSNVHEKMRIGIEVRHLYAQGH